MKKLWKFLTSMKFAIILLVILSLAMAGGSFIAQNQSFEWYAAQYSERTAAFIIALGLDDIFHSWWFFALFAILCLDLFFCNITKLPALIRRAKAAAKPKAGVFGPFVSHMGMLLLIIGFVLGQVTKTECTVYGFKGETKDVCDTGIRVTIEDFEVSFNEDDSVSQYTASLRATDGEKSASGTASVNHPVKLLGYKFYQNSFGYTALARVTKGGEALEEGRIIAGSGFRIPGNDNLSVVFNAFYPDYIFIDGSGPATQSGVMRNPGYLYTVYYGETVLGMNVLLSGEKITIDDYEVFLEDPGYYTVLQVKKDSFVWLVFLGGIVLLAGLFLSFYVKPLSIRNSEKMRAESETAEEQEEKERENASDH
ncbi:MAG: cytochrome c biogenesis protein ResB [Lachnospiraceae bacterium]|nr:cytochrome c biogenesis protein ResB [Lachnospiraceae bacterium]